jgi:hypothetical protein
MRSILAYEDERSGIPQRQERIGNNVHSRTYITVTTVRKLRFDLVKMRYARHVHGVKGTAEYTMESRAQFSICTS